MKPDAQQSKTIRVAEMFAGIGGFRLGLCGHEKWGVPGAGMQTVWANQWEPPGSAAKQFAWRCYEKRFGDGSCVNADVETVLDDVERGVREMPAFDLLCGGFPCQDYSVAKPAAHSHGIEGKKGVLWWQIERLIRRARPHYVLLENVDRLLKSPSGQRGRDFAIILNCLNAIGYSIEWRVVDASAYGFPQRRKRVFVYGELTDASWLFAGDKPNVRSASREIALRQCRCDAEWIGGNRERRTRLQRPAFSAGRHPLTRRRSRPFLLYPYQRSRALVIFKGSQARAARMPAKRARVHVFRRQNCLPRLPRCPFAHHPHRRGR